MKTPNERLQELRRTRGYKNGTDAARAFGWNKTTYLQHESGTRDVSRQAADRYARAYRSSAGYILFGEKTQQKEHAGWVRLAGAVGAGQQIIPSDDLSQKVRVGFDTEEVEAFEIIGDSMLPLAHDGDLVFCGPPVPPDRLVGCTAVVELEDGRRLFKQVEMGGAKGRYTLISLNAEPIRDVVVVSAGAFLGLKKSLTRQPQKLAPPRRFAQAS